MELKELEINDEDGIDDVFVELRARNYSLRREDDKLSVNTEQYESAMDIVWAMGYADIHRG